MAGTDYSNSDVGRIFKVSPHGFLLWALSQADEVGPLLARDGEKEVAGSRQDQTH